MKQGRTVGLIGLLLSLGLVCNASEFTAGLKEGKAELKSAGVLAFGPDGILFAGDSRGAAVYALDTGDRTANASAGPVEIRGINEKIAGILGTATDQILVNDVVVNPLSKRIYISVSRGRGPDALPVIVRTTSAGKLEVFALDNVRHSRVVFTNAPPADATDRRGQSARLEAITDLGYLNGKVYIAGLSNEEFASKLRAVDFPFRAADAGASVEIFHGSHGRFETNAPVRTFVPYEIAKEPHILAAYTCTPLVKFPVKSLMPGAKVVGTTIAELGNRNRPLDMIVYQREGRDYILMANSSRGVMKMSTEKIGLMPGITKQTEIAGLSYETLESLKGVQQLDSYDSGHAVVLIAGDGGALDLKTVALP